MYTWQLAKGINHVLGDEMECGCTLAALELLYFTNSLHFTDYR